MVYFSVGNFHYKFNLKSAYTLTRIPLTVFSCGVPVTNKRNNTKSNKIWIKGKKRVRGEQRERNKSDNHPVYTKKKFDLLICAYVYVFVPIYFLLFWCYWCCCCHFQTETNLIRLFDSECVIVICCAFLFVQLSLYSIIRLDVVYFILDLVFRQYANIQLEYFIQEFTCPTQIDFPQHP